MSRGHSLLANAVLQQAKRAMESRKTSGIYLISSYDGEGSVKVNVSFDPGTPPVESNWMPLGCIGVGNGWGVMVGPQIGDQVLVEFENGDVDSGVVVARLYSTVAQAMAVPSGEIWVVHQSTSSLKFKANGDINIVGNANLNATVAGNVTANVAGNVNATVTGGVTANVTGNLNATAAAATITAPTTINGNTKIVGTLEVTQKITGDADIQAAGNVSDQGGTKTMAGMRTAYDAHTGHGTSGTGNTPDHQM